MLEVVLYVVIGALIMGYPRKFIDMESKKFSDDQIRKSKSYNYLRKFLKENKALLFIKNFLVPLSFIIGLLLIGYGIYVMVITIKATGL